jgi:hypothetical protein
MVIVTLQNFTPQISEKSESVESWLRNTLKINKPESTI